MKRNKIIYNFLYLIIFANSFEEIKSDNPDKSYEIHIYFPSNGSHYLYCDENIHFFGTENINFYRINEYGLKININSLLRTEKSVSNTNIEIGGISFLIPTVVCHSFIVYDFYSVNEKIIIEFKDNPETLKELFSFSSISKIERFDYPFPIDRNYYNRMFYQCTQLTYIDFSNFNFENTKDISEMFQDCKKLNTVIFPQNSKSNYAESFRKMFENAESLTSIDLNYFSFVNSKNMEYMFKGCKNLCYKLKSIDLTNVSFLNAKSISFMFAYCSDLLEIKFKKNELVKNINDMKGIFANCTSITSIDISHIYINKTIILDSSFSNCSSLKEINISNIDTTKSFLINFLNNDNLEKCSFYNLDNIIYLYKSTVLKAYS